MKKKYIIFFLLILIIAIFFRIYNLGNDDLWFDEIVSYNCAHSKPFYTSNTTMPVHPYLYFKILRIWLSFFKTNEFNMRLLSALFGMLAFLPTFLVAKELFEKKIGVFAILLLAFSPFHIWYSQEAKMYAVFTFFTISTIYFFIISIKKNKIFWWGLFLLGFIMCLKINYFTFFLILPLSIFLLFKKQKIGYFYSRIVSWFFVTIIFCGGIFKKLISQLNFVGVDYWIPTPNLKIVLYTLENFNLGYTANTFLYKISLLCVIFIFSYLFFKRRELNDLNTKKVLLLVLFIGSILIQTYIFSYLFFSIYIDRAFLILLPFYCILLSGAIFSFRKKIIIYGVLIILLSCMSISIYNYHDNYINPNYQHHFGVHIKKPVEPTANFVWRRINKKEDLVGFTNLSLKVLFWYYWGGYKTLLEQPSTIFLMFPGLVSEYFQSLVVKHDFMEYINLDRESINKLNFRKLWIISSNWSRDGNLDDNSRKVLKYLREKKKFKIRETKVIDGIWISIFDKVTSNIKKR